MTIINSVIIGGGSGDEVEAYALGDAKNAVKDDKVALNFSAGLPMGEEDFLLSANQYNGEYLGPQQLFYVDREYIYYSAPNNRNNIYAYNKTTGVRSTIETSVNASFSWRSNIGLYGADSKAYQFISGKRYSLNLSAYSFCSSTSDGRIAVVCASQSYGSATDYRILTKDSEGFYKQIVYFTRADKGFPIALLDTEDSVNYPLICSNGSSVITYNLNTLTNSLDLVGSVANSSFSNSYHYDNTHNSASIGNITFRLGRSGSTFTYFNVFRTVKDSSGVYSVEMLSDLRQQVIDQIVLQGGDDYIRNLFFVGNVLSMYIDTASAQRGYYFFKVDTDKLTITGYDFAPNITNKAHKVLFDNGYGLTFDGIEGSNQKYTQSFMRPIEQKYTASPAQSLSFFANQTLTGIVKENNNGVLKVSTVEDPNNPPPAVPDEAGLKTVINYGSSDLTVNGDVIGAVYRSSDISVSNFVDAAGNRVQTDNPFRKILEANNEPVINTFEIVVPFYFYATSSYSQCIMETGPVSGDFLGFKLMATDLEKPRALISLKSGTNLSLVGTTTFSAGSTYLMKLTYNEKSGYVLYSKKDTDASWTTEASSSTTTEMVSTAEYLLFGYDNYFPNNTTYVFKGRIYFDGIYININGKEYYKGTTNDFGSVGVGYGYFRNTLTKPSDKYVSYEGGTLTKKDMVGRAYTMYPVIGRKADMGSWTSDTKGYLSAQEAVVLGANKKLPTPVYLWHDLSYITPVVPETLEPEVVVREDNAQVLQGVTTTGVTVDEHANITGFDAGGKRMAYINSPLYGKSVSNIDWWFSFTTGTTVTSIDRMICGFYDSVDSGDVNGFFLKTNNSGQVCLGHGTSSGSYWAIGATSLSTSTRYIVNIKYSASSGFTVTVQKGDDGSVVENLTAATTVTTTTQYLVFGCNVAAGGGGYNWNGSIGLGSYYITVDDTTTYFATPYTGTVSLPVSWKNIDGVLYEYPNGFPETQASELLDDNAIREGSNNLYVTRTGDSCGLVISTAPYGVDSSAVIGTVELDANGAIVSYSPSEGLGKVIFNGIDVTEYVTEVEVYVGPTRYTISEIPYSVLSEKGILGEPGFYTVTKVKPETGYFFAGDTSYSATSVSLNYVPGYNVLQFGTFKDGQYSTFTGELTFKKVEGGYIPAA